MNIRFTKRLLASVLSLAMLCNLGFTPVMASAVEGGVSIGTSSVCTHHTHDDNCGFAEDTPCAHECGEDCVAMVENCTHEHTRDCYPEDEASDNAASPSDTTDPGECGHICDADSGCVTTRPDCKHTHNDACGFVAGKDCTFAPADCLKCNPLDSGAELSVIVTGFAALPEDVREQSVPAGTGLTALNLPKTLTVTGYTVSPDTEVLDSGVVPEDMTIADVIWELNPANEVNDGNGTYDPTGGSYAFTPVLPVGYTVAEGTALPEIHVMVGVAKTLIGEEVATVTSDGTTTPYASAKEAFDAAPDGATVTLTADSTVAEPIEFKSKTLTLDLNGKILTGTNTNRIFWIDANANLTIQDSGTTGELTTNGSEVAGGLTGSTLTVKGGNFHSVHSNPITFGIDSLFIEDGTFTSRVGLMKSAEANLSGGSFTGGLRIATDFGGTGTLDQALAEGCGYWDNDTSAWVANAAVTTLGNITVKPRSVADITGKTLSQIKTDIEDMLKTETTVIVTGRHSGESETLLLSIPENKAVNWKAEYTYTGTGDALYLTGSGAFEISAGSISSGGSAIYSFGNVKVEGGLVAADASSYAIYANSVTVTKGIILGSCRDNTDLSWKVHGADNTLTQNAEIPEGKTLTIPEGAELDVPTGVTLQNRGTIDVYGTLTGTVGGIVNLYKAGTNANIEVLDAGGNPLTEALADDTVTLKLTVDKPETTFNLRALFAEKDKAKFYVGADNGGTLIGGGPVSFTTDRLDSSKVSATVQYQIPHDADFVTLQLFAEYGGTTPENGLGMFYGTAATSVTVTAVAEIGENKYSNIGSAIKAANINGGTIKLLRDSTYGGMLQSIVNTMTLDLDGNTLTLTNSNGVLSAIDNSASLTIKDSSESKTGKLIHTTSCAVNYNIGKLIIEGAAIESGAQNMGAVWVGETADVTINGGSFKGAAAALQMNAGSVELTGGTFHMGSVFSISAPLDKTADTLLKKGYIYYADTDTTATGTVVRGDAQQLSQTVTVGKCTHVWDNNWTGSDASGWTRTCINNCKAEDGSATQTAAVKVVSTVGAYITTYYPTVKEAFDAIPDSASVDLLEDSTVTNQITLNNKNIKFYPDRKTLTSTDGANSMFHLRGTTKLEISDQTGVGTLRTSAPAIVSGESGSKLTVYSGTYEITNAAPTTFEIEQLEIRGATFDSNVTLKDPAKAIIGGGEFAKLTAATGTLGEALEGGHGYKFTNSGTWVSDPAATTLAGVTVALTPIKITTPPADKSVDYGTATELTVEVEKQGSSPPAGNIIYQWYTANNDDPISGAETATLSIPGNTAAGTYRYYCKATFRGCTVQTNTATVTVNQSGTEFFGGVTTDYDNNTVTYNDAITISVTPKAAPSTRSTLVAPASNQMALFLVKDGSETQITEPQTVTNGTKLEFELDTTQKQLAIGENSIMAKYIESGNMAAHSETITVTLMPRPISWATVDAGATKEYNGTAAFTGIALTPSSIISGDTVTATADGTAASADVGASHEFTATATSLGGTHADYYSLATTEVGGTVAITAATPSVTVTADKKAKSFLRSIIGDHNDIIVLTATTGGANGERPDGSVVFKNGATTLATKATINGVATYEWEKPDAATGITITVEFTASDTNYISTTVIGNAGSFDIDKGAQAELNITGVPSKVTYGDIGFTLATSGGSGTGTTLTYAVTAGDAVSVNSSTEEVTIEKAGDATITVSKAGDSNFNERTDKVEITVHPAAPNVTFGTTTQSNTYSGNPVTVTVPPAVMLVNSEVYGGEITYSYKKVDSFINRLFEGYTAGLPTDAGKYEIKAHIAANGNYTAADSTNILELTINQSSPTLSINGIGTGSGKPYDGQPIIPPTDAQISLTGAAYSDIDFTYYADNAGSKGDLLTNGAPTNAGTYWVQGAIAETINTTAVKHSLTFTIAPKIVSSPIIELEYDTVEYSGTAKTPTVTVKDGLTTIPASEYTVGYSGNTNVGTATVTITDQTGGNYTVTGSTTFAITKTNQAALFITPVTGKTYGNDSFTLATTGGSGTGAVSYTITSGDAITISGSTATIAKAGSVVLTATKAGDTHYEPVTSAELTIVIAKADPAVTWPTNITAIFGQTLSEIAPAGNGTGAGTFTWTTDTTSVGNAGSRTHSMTFTPTDTVNYNTLTQAVTLTVERAAGPAISGPVTGSYTGDGETFTYTIAPIGGAEYSDDNSKWVPGNVFTGIEPLAKATFYARIKEDTNHFAGDSKNTGEVEFVKLTPTAAPTLGYTVSGSSGSRMITINTVTGAEYQFDGGAWGDTRAKTYTTDVVAAISIRVKATLTHNASPEATASVNLAKKEQEAPAAFVLKVTPNGETDYTVEIPAVAGGQYSFDGASWNDTRTTTANVGDTVTGFVRMKETDTHNASPSVKNSVTLPLFTTQKPSISPNGGSFTSSQIVTLACGTNGAAIYYTTDGSAPTAGGTLYSAPFILTGTATVKAIAIKTGMLDSPVASAGFTKQSSDTDGDTGDSTTTTTPPVSPLSTIDNTTNAETKVESKVDESGKAAVSVPEKSVTDAIKAAQAAKKTGPEKNGISVTVAVQTDKAASSIAVNLSQNIISELVKAGVSELRIESSAANITLDLKTLTQLEANNGNLAVSANAVKPSTLSAAAQAAIGSRPVFNLTLTVDGNAVTSFNGTVSVALPYTLAAGENPGNLYGVYVDENGKVTYLTSSSYDAIAKVLRFNTNHFSTFGIGYKADAPKFTDTANH